MTYDEWVKLDPTEMMSVGPDKILEIIKPLPWGFKEMSEETCFKLSDVHALTVTCSILNAMYQNQTEESKYNNLSSQLMSLIPDDTHTQTFLLGQISVKKILVGYIERTKRDSMKEDYH